MTTIPSRVAAGLLSFIFLTLAQGLDAHEMSVVSAEKSISGRTWKLQGGFANQPEAQLNEGMKALAEGLPIEQLQLDPNAVRSNATSGLLALEYSQWLKINELESSGKQWYRVEPKEMTERVEAKLVVVGTIPAVQIVVQQSIKQEPNFELDFTLLGDLLVTAGDRKSANNTSLFADMFLNDIPSQTEKQQSLRYLANELGKSSHSIQGTHRVSYNTGNQLSYISIPDEITSATLPNVYHQGQPVKLLTQNGSTLLTYLPTRTNLGSDQRDVLFLENGNPFGTSDFASTRPAFLTLTPTGIEVEQQRERTYADNLIYERATPLPVRERFVMYRVSRNQTRTTQLPFNDRLSTSTVEVSARLLSVTTTPGFSPDHYARLTIGGSQGPFELSWTGRREVQFEQTISLSPSTYSGGNTPISLAHQVPAITGGPSADIQNLEEITLRWTGYPRVDSTQRLLLELPAPAPGDELLPRRVTIGGFPAGTLPSSLVLLDVTDERNPIMVSGFPMFTDLSGTRALEFEATPGSTTFYVQPLSTISTLPAAVGISPLPELPPNGTPLKGIYVCPAEYKTALQPLVDYRGPGFIVLDPKAAYDHYSYGQESPEAIRDAIRDLIASASDVAEIPSIVLVGYATFDARNYLGLIAEPQ
ncbi:MAG: hypothetical protein SFY68_13465, partial [Candidatus Sumerlaeia bacterium]|nr:hypothetical protein [Candidatus Sumerlaeia bacterium]